MTEVSSVLIQKSLNSQVYNQPQGAKLYIHHYS